MTKYIIANSLRSIVRYIPDDVYDCGSVSFTLEDEYDPDYGSYDDCDLYYNGERLA